VRTAAAAAALVLAALPAGCASPGDGAARDEPTIRIPAGAEPRIVVEGEGIVLSAEAWDEEVVEIEARRTAAEAGDLARMDLRTEVEGAIVRIAGRTGGSGSPRRRAFLVRVRAPARAALEVRQAAGFVFAKGFRGGLSVDLADGSVAAEGVTGPLDLHTERGSVDVTGGDGPVRVLAGLGAVRYRGRPRGDSLLEAREGLLRVVLPGDAGLGILAVGIEGRIVNEFPGVAIEAEVVSGNVPGPDAGRLHLQCPRGDLEILAKDREDAAAPGARR
jgi:hypothetical protein